MYRVLYRKWRPQTFSDVSGQPHITETLANEVREKRLAHAYLFTGSRGTGKTSCAKILSKAINCLAPVNGNPCNDCEICRGIDNGSILDVVEIDAASNRGIDDIRALREESAFTPAQAKFRVYIIDEVHMLTIEAFNALLKTLEEPPEHIVFILATTEVQKLPSTILSRCQRFDFRRISVDAIVSRLKYVAEKENVTINESAAVLIARIADGGMRDALSVFDRCLSISENVTTAVVSDAAGLMSKEYLFSLSYAFKNKDTSKALSIIDELHSSSCDTERLCTELTNHFRSLLIIKSVKNPENIIVSTNEELDDLKKLSEQFSIDEILHIMNILSSAIAAIKVTQNRRIETEMAMIKICSPESSTDVSSLFARITDLEEKIRKLSENGQSLNTNTVYEPQKSTKTESQLQNKPVDLSSLKFEDDSAEYDDEAFFDVPPPSTPNDYESMPPFYDTETGFDKALPTNNINEITVPPFNEMPVFDNEPTQDSNYVSDAPIFDDFPEIEDASSAQDTPIFDETPMQQCASSTEISKQWNKCIIQAEQDCPPVTGHLLNTTAELNGTYLTIHNYNNVLPMIFPMVKDKLTSTVRRVTGIPDVNIRLG